MKHNPKHNKKSKNLKKKVIKGKLIYHINQNGQIDIWAGHKEGTAVFVTDHYAKYIHYHKDENYFYLMTIGKGDNNEEYVFHWKCDMLLHVFLKYYDEIMKGKSIRFEPPIPLKGYDFAGRLSKFSVCGHYMWVVNPYISTASGDFIKSLNSENCEHVIIYSYD